MPHSWLDHTAELGLEVEGPTEAAVFSEAVAALGELLAGAAAGAPGAAVTRRIAVEGRDRATQLAECLTEALFLAETEDLIPTGLSEVTLREGAIEAMLEGRRGRARPLVKAVTYHDLRFDPVEGGWRANLVLDV